MVWLSVIRVCFWKRIKNLHDKRKNGVFSTHRCGRLAHALEFPHVAVHCGHPQIPMPVIVSLPECISSWGDNRNLTSRLDIEIHQWSKGELGFLFPGFAVHGPRSGLPRALVFTIWSMDRVYRKPADTLPIRWRVGTTHFQLGKEFRSIAQRHKRCLGGGSLAFPGVIAHYPYR